jgi:hypothetical protein
MINDQQPLSSHEYSSMPTLPTGEIRAIFGRPHLNTRGSDRVAPHVHAGEGMCVSSGRCKGLNGESAHLRSTDMLASNDAQGTGRGKDWVCYHCSTPGLFARDCPQISATDMAARTRDAEGAHAWSTWLPQRFNRPCRGGGTARGVDAGWSPRNSYSAWRKDRGRSPRRSRPTGETTPPLPRRGRRGDGCSPCKVAGAGRMRTSASGQIARTMIGPITRATGPRDPVAC